MSENGPRWIEVDLALLVRLLRLADAAQAWRGADGAAQCASAKLSVWEQIERLMAMCPTARSPLIKGLTPVEIRALVESAEAAERGAVN